MFVLLKRNSVARVARVEQGSLQLSLSRFAHSAKYGIEISMRNEVRAQCSASYE